MDGVRTRDHVDCMLRYPACSTRRMKMKGGLAGAQWTGQMGHEMKPTRCIRMERERAFRAEVCQRGSFRGLQVEGKGFSPCPKLLLTTHPCAAPRNQPKTDYLQKASCKKAISPYQRLRALAEEPNRALNQRSPLSRVYQRIFVMGM